MRLENRSEKVRGISSVVPRRVDASPLRPVLPMLALAGASLRLLQLEGAVQGAHGVRDLLLVDQAGDADLAGRDQLNVDAGLEQRRRH